MKTAPLVVALVCTGILAAWLAFTKPPLPAERSLPQASLDPVDVPEIIHDVEKLHGSKFALPPAIQRVSPQTMQEKIRSTIAQDFPPTLAAARERAALAFGLTRLPFDWVDSLTGIIMENTRCHYDHVTHTFFVPEVLAPGDPDRIAFTVALSLDLPGFPALRITPFDPINDDAALAAHVVLQGRAARIQTRYSIAHPLPPAPVSTAPGYYQAPPWLRSRLQFPSGIAPSFLERLPEALAAVPRSSAEVMHPGRYQNSASPPPAEATLPSPPEDGPALIFDNVMGEFGILQIFKAYLTQESANLAAAGWKADRYLLFSIPGESVDAVFWQTEWTSEDDAGEFLTTAHEWLLARFSLPANPSYQQPGGGLFVETPGASFRTARGSSPHSVRLLLSTDRALLRRLLPTYFP